MFLEQRGQSVYEMFCSFIVIYWVLQKSPPTRKTMKITSNNKFAPTDDPSVFFSQIRFFTYMKICEEYICRYEPCFIH